MQPRSACEEAGIEIRRYREKKKEKYVIFVFLGMHECSKLLLAMALGPIETEEAGIEKRNKEKAYIYLPMDV
jgi:hypothetical protein